jgi:hypothetical protein
MTKTYNAAGVSRTGAGAPLKIRMATDIEWRKFDLERAQHVDIQLVALPGEMSKTDAVVFLQTAAEFVDNAEAQAVFTAYLTNQGVIERPKKPRGRPAKAKVEAVAEVVTADDQPSQELIDAVTETPLLADETAAETAELVTE